MQQQQQKHQKNIATTSNTIDMSSINVVPNNSKSQRVKNRIKQIILDSTAHGIPHFFRSERKILKCMWIILFIICISTSIMLIVSEISQYLEYETVTNIKLIHEQPIGFPTISLQFNSGNNINSNYSISRNVIKLYFNNILLTSREYVYDFEICFDNDNATYFKYNSGKNRVNLDIPFKNQTIAGILGGLTAEIFIGKPNDFCVLADSQSHNSFLSIYIHNSKMNPVENAETSIKLTPGFSTELKISRILTDKLPEPYNECLDDSVIEKFESPLVQYILKKTKSEYRQKDCFNLCLQQYLINVCNLTTPLGSTWQFGNELNDSKNKLDCDKKERKKFLEKNVYNECKHLCPSECHEVEYQIEYVMSKFPSVPYANELISEPYANSVIKQKYDKNYNITLEDLRESLVSFSVYYESFKYIRVSQLPKTDLTNLVSNFGGLLGLFTGISFLSFGEPIEIIFEIILIALEKKRIIQS